MALLLTGPPGIGKTTLIRTIADRLVRRRLAGFYTEEIRSGRERKGFRLATFAAETATIAHTDFPGPRVSKYGVDVEAIDRLVRAALDAESPAEIFLADEIGKMECLSRVFVAKMRQLLDSGRPLVATIAQRGGGFIEEVKRRQDVELWSVTRANRDALVDRVVERLRGT